MSHSLALKAAYAVLGILALVGIAFYVLQLINGLSMTGMNNTTSWGLYIICFMFFVGLSAGGLIVASSASVFHITQYKKVALPAVLLSTVCIVIAALLVCIDLGNVGRIYNLLLHGNFTSPLMWDVCVITIYLILNIVYLIFMTRPEPNQHAIGIVSRFALPTAILVHSVTAWIFGLQIARAAWNSAIMAPLFVVSAMDSGLALFLIVLIALNATGIFKTDGKLIASLAGLMATCVAIDGFMVFCEVLTMSYSGAESEIVDTLLFGATAPFFWTEMIVGVIIPFLIMVFSKNRCRKSLVALASACVIVGVFCKRVWLLLTGFSQVNVFGGPGVIDGVSSPYGSVDYVGSWATFGSYAPTGNEIAIVIGLISLGALVFMVLASKLLPRTQDESAHRD